MTALARLAFVTALVAANLAGEARAQEAPYGVYVPREPSAREVEVVDVAGSASRYCDRHQRRHGRRYCRTETGMRRNYYFPAYYWNGNVYQGYEYPYYGYPNCGYPFERGCGW